MSSEKIEIGGSGEPQNNNNNNHNGVNEKRESQPPTDFKICEIWIRNGDLHMDAVEGFWEDKIRSVGILEYCKDIVKNNNFKKQESKIITAGSMKNNVINFVRNGLKRKR